MALRKTSWCRYVNKVLIGVSVVQNMAPGTAKEVILLWKPRIPIPIAQKQCMMCAGYSWPKWLLARMWQVRTRLSDHQQKILPTPSALCMIRALIMWRSPPFLSSSNAVRLIRITLSIIPSRAHWQLSENDWKSKSHDIHCMSDHRCKIKVIVGLIFRSKCGHYFVKKMHTK